MDKIEKIPKELQIGTGRKTKAEAEKEYLDLKKSSRQLIKHLKNKPRLVDDNSIWVYKKVTKE